MRAYRISMCFHVASYMWRYILIYTCISSVPFGVHAAPVPSETEVDGDWQTSVVSRTWLDEVIPVEPSHGWTGPS